MKKILIVDDSDTLRIQLRGVLEECGYEVIEATNGLEGLNKARENKDVKLLVSDFNMPELDGISMCRRIKEEQIYSKVPIFMLTTETSSELKAIGKEVGIMAWIVKPFNEEKFKAVVKKVLEEA